MLKIVLIFLIRIFGIPVWFGGFLGILVFTLTYTYSIPAAIALGTLFFFLGFVGGFCVVLSLNDTGN
jgi:hypothetical protein